MLYLTSALAATAALQAASLLPAPPAVARVTDVSMFTGGARAAPKKRVAPKKKAPPKKAAPSAAKGLFSGGLAPAKAKTKLAVSSAPTAQTYIDVTGAEYIENTQTFGMPQYDEIGVLPPLGRWDPLQIREQGPERYRRFLEMEIKHGRLAMAGFLGVVT